MLHHPKPWLTAELLISFPGNFFGSLITSANCLMAAPKPIFIFSLKMYYQCPIFATVELKHKEIRAKFTVCIFVCQKWDMKNYSFKNIWMFESNMCIISVLTNFVCNVSQIPGVSLGFFIGCLTASCKTWVDST